MKKSGEVKFFVKGRPSSYGNGTKEMTWRREIVKKCSDAKKAEGDPDPESFFDVELEFEFTKGELFRDHFGDVDSLIVPVLNALFTARQNKHPGTYGGLTDVSDARVKTVRSQKSLSQREGVKITVKWFS
jgi:hypothetical protein